MDKLSSRPQKVADFALLKVTGRRLTSGNVPLEKTLGLCEHDCSESRAERG